MPNIIVRDLSFRYSTQHSDLFTDLSLTLSTAWRCALVGRNGRGKTTLLRLLDGQLTPHSGQISLPLPSLLFPGTTHTMARAHDVAREAAGPYRVLEQRIEHLSQYSDQASLIELSDCIERYEALEGYEIDAGIDRELSTLQIDGRRAMHQLSSGEQTRVLLAGLFARQHVYPLIDEPTNHLDVAGRKLVTHYLAGKPGFLLVSHDRTFVDHCCDHVLGLNRADSRLIQGNYTDYRRELDRDNDREQRTNVRLKKDIRRLQQAASERRTGAHARESDKGAHTDSGYIGHKAAKQMQRALNLERRRARAATETQSLLHNVDKIRPLKLASTGRKIGTPLCQVNNLAIGFDGVALAQEISFELLVGDRMLITGANGAGKSCLIQTLLGAVEPLAGTIRWAPGVTWQQARQQPRPPFKTPSDWDRLRQILGVLGFDDALGTLIRSSNHRLFPSTSAPLEAPKGLAVEISEGQLKKIELAYSLLEPADFLVWDEALNFIDIETRQQLLELVHNAQPTLLLVEHDAFFTASVATRELAVSSA